MIRYPTLAASARLAASADGRALAVVDGPARWSWSDLDRAARSIAASLARAGAGQGARVGLVARPSAAAVAALHGIARVGAVAAPVSPGLTVAEQAAAFDVIEPLLVLRAHDSARPSSGQPTIEIEDAIAAEPAGSGVDDAAEPAARSAPAVAVLTSGTTARPKAVVLSTAAMAASAESWLAALPPATGWLLAVGLSHVAGLGVVWRASMSGVPLTILERPDLAAILDALATDPRPSHVSLVPTVLLRLLDHHGDALPPTTLRAVPLGGGPIAAGLVERALAAGWPVVPTYGLSEAGSGVTALPTAEARARPGSAGRPLPGVRIRIGEPDGTHDPDAPDPGGSGEILVDSPARFDGYLGDAAGSAAALTHDGWLRTGDIGRIDAEGYLTVEDRRTDRIVRGGENVSPAEVEAVLLEHPAVADAAVVGRSDPVFGQVPVAIVVVRAGSPDPTDDDLARHCRARLAGHKVPVAFERRLSLPRTAGGKLRRAELRTTIGSHRTAEELPA